MIRYLNNNDNVAGKANENYAREIMELHTLGVDGGYNADDIAELARIFTGWHESGGEFAFNDALHDNGDKIFLAQSITGSGVAEGERVLDILSRHPSTAAFICRKLISVFVGEQAADELRQQCVLAFIDSDGDIRTVLQLILSAEPMSTPQYVKLKTPLELVIAMARGFDGELDSVTANEALYAMGMNLFEFPLPTGFSEVSADWINSNALLQRMRLVNRVAWQHSDAVHIDFKSFLLEQGYSSAEAVIGFLFELALANRFTPLEYQIALDILNESQAFDIHDSRSDDKLKRLLGTVLSFPGYQYQ